VLGPGDAVRIGVSLPVFLSRTAPVPDVPALARQAERLGMDAVWAGDHLSAGMSLLESTVVLAAAAAVTERITIGYAVMLLALRQPAWAAKQIGTLQLLSGNRLALGVGVGGEWPQEWQAAGIAPRERGRRTDAILATLPSLLAGEPTRLGTEPGEPVVTLAPAAPMPPLWVGGGSEHALRRAVRHGAGWLGSMIDPPRLAARVGTLTGLAEQAELPEVPPVGVVVFAALADSGVPPHGDRLAGFLSRIYGLPAEHAAEIVVSGPPALLAERLHQYAAAGASQFVVAPSGPDIAEQYALVARARAALAGM
jgi:alkanesulfonate monooxygenase SsuD/methylene tetrahydromethanopterin reductase-like flavin-dependent oxidoreductase (luciferase family)